MRYAPVTINRISEFQVIESSQRNLEPDRMGRLIILTALKVCFFRIVIMSLILSSFLPFSARGSSHREVAATVNDAEQAIAVGFEAALDAEQAGANVSSLLVKLYEGAELLSVARMAFEDGDYDEAARLSGLSSEVSAQVESEALILKVEARNAAFNKYQLYLAGSAVAIVIVVIATLLSYRFLKKRYLEHTLKMKPEVEKA